MHETWAEKEERRSSGFGDTVKKEAYVESSPFAVGGWERCSSRRGPKERGEVRPDQDSAFQESGVEDGAKVCPPAKETCDTEKGLCIASSQQPDFNFFSPCGESSAA